MKPHLDLLRAAENVLLKALADFKAPGKSSHATEFNELRVQAAIFNYDICSSMVSLWVTEPRDFAQGVALKSIVLKLYEYDVALSSRLVNRILRLAQARGMDMPSDTIKQERRKWRDELARLKKWSDLRNQAAGHYGKDIGRQVTLISELESKDVMSVAKAFLSFNNAVSKVLASVGRGKAGI
ncbi:MAG: hypothetical protein WDO56_12120 [Gammaproteobacteria bacterium]